MSKGSKLMHKSQIFNEVSDLINKEISLAYEKGFLSGYNQPECLNHPEEEASFQARKYTANNN